MKKLFAIILTVALLLGLSVPTFAEESQTATITVVMKDSGGDGWAEGTFGFISVSTDEFVYGNNSGEFIEGMTEWFFLEDGTTATITHTVAKDEVVYFRWIDLENVSDEEASFNIYRDGILQYSCDDVTKFDGSASVFELFFTSYPDQRGTNVTYTVDPTYTVTIPATVALGETATISAENVVVPKGQQVEIALTDANGFTVATPQGAKLGYTVKNGETTVNEGDTVLTVNPDGGKTGETTLKFVAPETVKFAGDYTGTVAFTIAVKDVPVTIINFTFEGTAYQAEEGMTLCQWAESKYDVNDKYYDAGDGTVKVNGNSRYIEDAVIVDGKEYRMRG